MKTVFKQTFSRLPTDSQLDLDLGFDWASLTTFCSKTVPLLPAVVAILICVSEESPLHIKMLLLLFDILWMVVSG